MKRNSSNCNHKSGGVRLSQYKQSEREKKSNKQEMAGNYKKEENNLKRSEGLQKLSII